MAYPDVQAAAAAEATRQGCLGAGEEEEGRGGGGGDGRDAPPNGSGGGRCRASQSHSAEREESGMHVEDGHREDRGDGGGVRQKDGEGMAAAGGPGAAGTARTGSLVQLAATQGRPCGQRCVCRPRPRDSHHPFRRRRRLRLPCCLQTVWLCQRSPAPQHHHRGRCWMRTGRRPWVRGSYRGGCVGHVRQTG